MRRKALILTRAPHPAPSAIAAVAVPSAETARGPRRTDPRPAAERIALVRDGIAEWKKEDAVELLLATACPPAEVPDWADYAVELEGPHSDADDFRAQVITLLEEQE